MPRKVAGLTLSAGLRWLLIAEINNEHDPDTGGSRDGNSSPGGAAPATLGSALSSVVGGYSPDLGDELNMLAVAAELGGLAAARGIDSKAADFLTAADWAAHEDGRLQEEAINPEEGSWPPASA